MLCALCVADVVDLALGGIGFEHIHPDGLAPVLPCFPCFLSVHERCDVQHFWCACDCTLKEPQ